MLRRAAGAGRRRAASASPAAPSTPSPTPCCAATARPLGLEPSFTILDRGDAEDVINLLRSRAGLDRKDRRFPRKNTIARDLQHGGQPKH